MSAMVEYSPDCLQPALNIFLTKLEELTHARRSNIGNEVVIIILNFFRILKIKNINKFLKFFFICLLP